MASHGIVRTIYLYLFALVGLFMVTFSVANMVGAILDRYVWPEQFVDYEVKPIETPETPQLTQQEKEERFRAQQHNSFRNSFSSSLGFLVVGLPLWVFHWGLIKKDHQGK